MTNHPNEVAVGLLVFTLLTLPGIFAWGRIYNRGGLPFWHLFGIWVPFLNFYVMGRLLLRAGYRWWWALLIFVPFGFLCLAFRLAYGTWPMEEAAAQQAAPLAARVPLIAWAERTKVITLKGAKVRTFDDTLRMFEDPDLPDFQSAVKFEVPYGTELQLGAATEIEGLEWIEAFLPDGTAGYVLASSVRTHSMILGNPVSCIWSPASTACPAATVTSERITSEIMVTPEDKRTNWEEEQYKDPTRRLSESRGAN